MSSSPDLNEARRLIAEYVSSAEQLEVLLLLHAERDRDFNSAEISGRIYTVPSSATLRLEELVGLGLASSDQQPNPRYRYAPASSELGRRVDQLADAYRADRVSVIKMIFATPQDPARAFSNAFLLRGGGG